jgi:signal transduction histidine kinase
LISGKAIVLADSNQVSQLFVIILTNAFEALETEQGEIDFSIHAVAIAFEQECLHGQLVPGLYAKITVSDNGLGVSQDRIDKIFDPFYTSKNIGSGMGLSIARGIVMAHNGGIDFRSMPFRGSTITVYLPARAADELPALPLDSVPEADRSTILLVDDQLIYSRQ